MRLRSYFLPAVILIISSTSLRAADGIQQTFQQGLFEEEANQNLEAAIQAYQSVLTQLDAQRKLAATTLFRLGECYRKQGKTNEAVVQFERILREFNDQTILLRLSEQNLSALGASRLDPLDAKPQTPSIPEEEAKEIERLKILIANSPDLINADQSGLNSQTPLQKAVASGYLTAAKFLLENGADPNLKRNYPSSPIAIAAENGNKAMVELLLQFRADVNAKDSIGETALHRAARKGFRTVAETLIAAKADVNPMSKQTAHNGYSDFGTPLHVAAYRGDAAMAELLVQHGATINVRGGSDATELHLASRSGNARLVEFLLSNGSSPDLKINAPIVESDGQVQQSFQGFTPLHFACYVGSTEIARLLLSKKVDVNALASFRRTPLHVAAARTSNPDLFQLLLESGADVNAVSQDARTATTALHAAIGNRNLEGLRIILAFKPNTEIRDWQGKTPLQISLLIGEEFVRLLLDAGANPNVRDESGETPLHVAVKQNNLTLVEWLLAHKADVTIADNSGRTPLEYASGLSRSTNPTQPGGIPVSGPLPSRTPRNIPTRSQVSPAPQSEISELLRKAGLEEQRQRSRVISVSCPTQSINSQILSQDQNSLNRYTLFESIAIALNQGDQAGRQFFSFPDFSRIQIRRLEYEAGKEKLIAVDLEEALSIGDCSKNIQLEWGDIVEVPEREHNPLEQWLGLDKQQAYTIRNCLTKNVEIRFRGQSTKRSLVPVVKEDTLASKAVRYSVELPDLQLGKVIRSSEIDLTNADLSKVTVRRVDPATQKQADLVLDVSKSEEASHLRLMEGDVIELTEKR